MPTKPLEPNMWNLEDLFHSSIIYSVPVYQRPYSWDKDQVTILLDDLIKEYSSDSRNDGYYTGNLIIYDNNESINGIISKYEIIDGQQRITTFALILLSIYCISNEIGISDNDRTFSKIKDALWKLENREYKKELRAVNLNSIERKCFEFFYNHCFDAPKDIITYCQNYKLSSKFDERIINNFKTIYTIIRNQVYQNSEDNLLDFADYLLTKVQFIVIITRCRENKVFSMFESINSKGKRLQEIDLIKTYIFSNLDETSYSKYLNIWGELIIRTNDDLYDYILTYIKAYISFYRGNIYIKNFKLLCKKELLFFFNVQNETEALKCFLDDLYNKVDYYIMLFSSEKAFNIIKTNKFKFFYQIFTSIPYIHPKPLFFRALIEHNEGKLSKEDITTIVVDVVGFMIKFLTICDRDSKDAITMFSNIMNDIYKQGEISKENIHYYIATELITKNVTPEKIKNNLASLDGFEQNKYLSVALLALYESTKRNNKGELNTSYNQAYTLLKSFSDSFSLDHLLVQKPDCNSEFFKYYEKNGLLVLKSNNDFPTTITNGMDYDLFTKTVLNRLGNLRIYYRDKNSERGNDAIELKEYEGFYTYKAIEKRSKELVNFIIDKCIPAPDIDINAYKSEALKKSEEYLPKMAELMERGLIREGDIIYNTVVPDTSKATLLNEKYVNFNGEKITLNEWGCKVTGWKSIRIYAYTAIEGEIETLQDKRLKLINDNI